MGDALSGTFMGRGEAALSLSAPKSTFNKSGRFRLELPERARRAHDRSEMLRVSELFISVCINESAQNQNVLHIFYE